MFKAKARENILFRIVFGRWLQASLAIGQQERALFEWRMWILQNVPQTVVVAFDTRQCTIVGHIRTDFGFVRDFDV